MRVLAKTVEAVAEAESRGLGALRDADENRRKRTAASGNMPDRTPRPRRRVSSRGVAVCGFVAVTCDRQPRKGPGVWPGVQDVRPDSGLSASWEARVAAFEPGAGHVTVGKAPLSQLERRPGLGR
jgi:hypothetical protein